MAQTGIINDLGLSVAQVRKQNHFMILLRSLYSLYTYTFLLTFVSSLLQYSMFGSSMTFGGMFGAIFSGKVADLIGRKGVILNLPSRLSVILLLSLYSQ